MMSMDEIRKVLQQHEPVYVTIARSNEEYLKLKKLGFKDSEIICQFKEDATNQLKEEE